MRRLSIKWLVTVLVLLCGCGGGTRTLRLPSTSTSGPPPQDLNIPGNWELATRSTLGVSALAIAGSIIQSGSTLSGAVHLDGSSCFEQATAIGLTGTLTDGNISLTSAPVNDIIISLTGTITKRDGYPYQLNGTYTTDGGCAGGDQGNVIGYSVDGISGPWNGNLTTGGGADIHWGTVQLGQVGASSEGSFGLTGNFTFDGACFNSGQLTPGTFPTPSFILGTSMVFDIATDNGTIAFVGRADPDGLIRGSYTVTGGSCESSGTGYLSPWEY